MKIINKSMFLQGTKKGIASLRDSVFIYPTDTIYGIGCDATNDELVKKIRLAKNRNTKPFSVIAPSKDWIKQNLEVKEEFDEFMGMLPGPFTLILKIKNPACVSKEVTAGIDSLGVRIPEHWISGVVKELGFPVVTTSVNLASDYPVLSLTDVPAPIQKFVEFAIDEGTLDSAPSTIINLTKSPPDIIKRGT
jgi:tRNA threonylcarbamoyl adenosine modification protein (Sua5/YciO/YrdC/YwlC family)